MDSSDNLVISARTDREAFGRLFDLYYPNVFRYCLRRLFVRAVAEDVTSEVFLRVATHMRDFPGTTKEDFQRWLYRVATNEVNASVRRMRLHRELLESGVKDRSIRVIDNVEHSADDGAHLDWAELHRAILTLKPREQTIITLRFSEQMSHDQIARVLNLQPASVRVVLCRALEKLRARLGVSSGRTRANPKD